MGSGELARRHGGCGARGGRSVGVGCGDRQLGWQGHAGAWGCGVCGRVVTGVRGHGHGAGLRWWRSVGCRGCSGCWWGLRTWYTGRGSRDCCCSWSSWWVCIRACCARCGYRLLLCRTGWRWCCLWSHPISFGCRRNGCIGIDWYRRHDGGLFFQLIQFD